MSSHRIFVLAGCIIASVLAGCALHEEISGGPSCDNCIFFDVRILNESTILVNGNSEYASDLFFGNEYSNALPYIEFIDPHREFASVLALKSKKFSYLVHFPIYWSKSLPYSALSEEGGIAEASFLFPRTNGHALFSIDFHEEVFLSGLGTEERFEINESDLMNSYLIFGNLSVQCSKVYGNAALSISSIGNFRWNDSYCAEILSIVNNYSKEFGNRLQSDYMITFSDARSYSSLPSGFFVDEYNLNFIAHELFHAYQPKNKCMENIFYKEGLATYMQHYVQMQTGIITKREFDARMDEYLQRISSIENILELYYEDDLNELRKRDPGTHGLLIYAKGALLWDIIDKSESAALNSIFLKSLNESDCEDIDSLLSRYESELYLTLHTA